MCIRDRDKAAVDALKAEIDAFNTKYKGYPGFTEITYNTGLDKKIEIALYQDAVEKINAIPEELTYADKETVESARAAYDALSDGQKDALNPSFKNKLESAEKQIELLAVKSVESLKVVKNHSTAGRTNGKSWIRIEWSTVGDDAAVDGYEIYKSTKKRCV